MKNIIPNEQRSKTISNIIVVAAGIGMATLVIYFTRILAVLNTFFSIISPFLVGAAVAFLMVPLLRRVEIIFNFLFFRKKRHPKLNRVLSVIVCYVLLIAFLTAFVGIVFPMLIDSVKSIINFIGNFISANYDKINELLLRYDILSIEGEELVIAWGEISTTLMNYTGVIVDNIVALSKNIYSVFLHTFVGLIVSVYVLVDKENFAAKCKKVCYAILPRKRCESLIFWSRRANHIFTGFIAGKILDSMIIGVLCYLGMLIFKIEYPLLISVIIGVTNILPFFGPFIGAIPSIIILLIVNPWSALWFAIFIIVLQQLDGNLIGPFILGDSVGISAFSIMVAILLGGGLFGFTGMLLAVPVFALIYAVFHTYLERLLTGKDLPINSIDYMGAPESLHKNSEEASHK